MSNTPPDRRPPLGDSPWFWMYLFATAAFFALLAIGPKYDTRQAGIERQGQARQRIDAQAANRPMDNVPVSTIGRTLVTLRPLRLTLGVVLTLAWAALCWSRLRGPRDRAVDDSGGAQP